MTYLKRKGISLSPKVYFIDALSYMALGLFATLVVGLILKTAGGLLSLSLIVKMGTLAMGLMGPAIGVAVAYRLNASPLIIFASVVSGAAGAELGGPAGSFAAALIGVEIGKLVSGETRIDIILTPLVTIITGFFTAAFIGPGIQYDDRTRQAHHVGDRSKPADHGHAGSDHCWTCSQFSDLKCCTCAHARLKRNRCWCCNDWLLCSNGRLCRCRL